MKQMPSLLVRVEITFRAFIGRLVLTILAMAPLNALSQYQSYTAPFRFLSNTTGSVYTNDPLVSCKDYEGIPGYLSQTTAFVYDFEDNYDNPVTEYVLEDSTYGFVHCYGYGPAPIRHFPSVVGSPARYHYCPYGGELFQYGDTRECRFEDQPPTCPAGIDPETGLCIQAKTCPVGANPIDPASGAKLHDQVDIVHSSAAHPLNLQRYYNSQSPYWGSELSRGWSHNWQRHLVLTARQRASPTVAVLHEDGSHSRFNRPLGSTKWFSADQSKDTFDELRDIDGVLTGYTVKRSEADALETYSAEGLLLSVRERNGWVATLRYSDAATPASIAPRPGLLIEVRNHFGRKLQFRYDAQARLVRSLDFAGKAVRYRYDDAGRLDRVTWQDNKFRTYHYEDPRFPNALTGVTDEAGVRYATYAYDDQGRAKSTELAGGKGRVEVQYNADGTSTVTDYSGAGSTSSTYTFETAGGNIRPTTVSGPCVLCGSTQQSSSYDRATGALNKSIAHDGTVTFYQYDDAKGRETERATFLKSFKHADTRPPLANATKVVSTRWHAKWNLPLTVAEPNKITDYGYDGNGNRSSESWSATKDDTGAAKFDPVKVGDTIQRSWKYTASTNLLETATESVNKAETGRWTWAYDTSGLGQVRSVRDVTNDRTGRVDRYDAQGRILDATSDLGVKLGYRYSPRGFMKQAITDGQTVTMDQNDIGLTTDALMPDGQKVKYVYDDTHRLVDVKINGVSISTAMIREGGVPHRISQAYWLRTLAILKGGLESLLPAAIAQAGLPAPPIIIPVPGASGPGQPIVDPLTDSVLSVPPFNDADRKLAEIIEQIVRACQCDPEGGYNKPTLTRAAYSHLLLRGHLSELWANQSYFTTPVTQSLVDEIVSKGTAVFQKTRVTYTADLGRSVGMVRINRSSSNPFEPTRFARVVVETANCGAAWERSRNEVVTMFPVEKGK
jgi:YD repeat-containing protein